MKNAILSSLFPEKGAEDFTPKDVQNSFLPSEFQGTSISTPNSDEIMEYVYLPIIDGEDEEVSFNIKNETPITITKKRKGSEIELVR